MSVFIRVFDFLNYFFLTIICHLILLYFVTEKSKIISVFHFYTFSTCNDFPEKIKSGFCIPPEVETGQSPPLARNNVMPEVETGQSPLLAGKKVIPAAERLG